MAADSAGESKANQSNADRPTPVEPDDDFRGPPTGEEAAAWRSAAKVGNTDAMYNMGILCYQQGQLTGSDSAETWWIQAAKQDHTEAQMNLGLLRYEQDRVLGDDSAESWWRSAAEGGNTDAACNLGAIRQAQQRYRGDDSAEYWWLLAAGDGNDDAAYNLQILNDEHPATTSAVELKTRKPGDASGRNS